MNNLSISMPPESMDEMDFSEDDIEQYMEESDFKQNNIDLPRNPGPSAVGHTPLIGTVRRNNGVPVVRERVVEELDELDAINVRSSPLLPVLRTR